MELLLLFEHRFYRDTDGTIFSVGGYDYQLLRQRYLSVFDTLTIVARVSDVPPRERGSDRTEGPGVRVVALPDWTGLRALAAKVKVVRRTLLEQVQRPTAVILVVPSLISVLMLPALSRNRPYALEVVGDPAGLFAGAGSARVPSVLARTAWPWVLRRLCRRACAVGYVTRETLQRHYPPAPRAFTTNYSSIQLPAAAVRDSPRQWLTPPSPVRALTIGSLAQRYKGVDVLIDAVARCRDDGQEVLLRVAGDGRYREELEEQARSLGVEDVVTFLGRISPTCIREEMAAADLFVLASRTEGLPRVVIEALSSGLPCVATTAGGIPELLDGEVLVPPDDASALARRILAVSGSTDTLGALSARGLVTAVSYTDAVLDERRRALYEHLRQVTAARG